MTTRVVVSIVFTSLLGWAALAHAQIPVGVWERTDAQGKVYATQKVTEIWVRKR